MPDRLREVLELGLIDVVGLCVAARRADYVRAVIESGDAVGQCTAIGHEGGFNVFEAALINGTAAHGEDFDDTFEGTPVHAGAVIVPAVLGAAEAFGRGDDDIQRGLAVGYELTCRLALVAPTAIHRAGFHPTAVIGALGSAAGVATALGLDAARMASALGIAGSFASGIIEYLAEGAWTKRIHGGWAAQAGIRAARLAAAGFVGPRTVIEGEHGFFKVFAEEAIPRRFEELIDGLGVSWQADGIAFKPYACGTMAQPFIDCALALRRGGIEPDSIERIHCTVGEGTVHRLWEPRAEKISPSSSYSAKFSVPYCIAIALIDGAAGLEQFSDARVADPRARSLAGKVVYEIDPANEYPRNYTGDLRVTLADGRVVEAKQPHLRGGRKEPLTRAEIVAKMRANVAHGGWSATRADDVDQICADVLKSGNVGRLRALRV